MQDLWQVHYSNLDDKLTERTHKIKCKDFDCFLEH